ncbi:protein pad-1 [Ditylenchus destructor]|uniref:Protein pad-1 n=1 Tax=Ditylenchus destructor TaxID=166010 RepID=A0AAD4RDB9_9BILA|nr:protein pad-1 [Ditylenchus destructor]
MSTAYPSEASTSSGNSPSNVYNSSKFRSYVSAVDKALKSFENTTEWADLIAALGKLGKVFSSNAKLFNEIPNSVTVAKRLSQCLHPALPSGVHLKALETYRQVFLILGRTENLPKYLYLFAIGLFPLMDHCGIKVKSELLAIFEQFLLPLGTNLRPALPGFIAAVLLGLEEGTEFYGRTFKLLEQVMDKVGEEEFYACFWQAVLGSSPVRLPALLFLNAKLEKRKEPISEYIYIISGGTHANHMIDALCAVAEDPGSTLVQRHLLDFLCSSFPLDSNIIPRADLVRILCRCLFVVLRRDMSLNRRLYQWLLNRSNDVTFSSLPVSGSEDLTDMDFFKTYTLPLIKFSIRDYLEDSQIQFAEVRVCRLLHYFLDRPELGHMILNETLELFLEFVCMQDTKLIQEFHDQCEELDPSFSQLWEISAEEGPFQTRRTEEARKTYNSLLNTLDAGYLWQYFGKLFLRLIDDAGTLGNMESLDSESVENLGYEEFCAVKGRLALFPLMVSFCLKTVQLDSHGDIRGKYLPSLLQTIMTGVLKKGCDTFSRDIVIALLVVSRKLLHQINQSVSIFESVTTDRPEVSSPTKREALRLQYRKECVEEQRLVESCLSTCCCLMTSICQWYVKNRDRDKIGILCAISVLLRDFADFPLYCFQPLESGSCSPINDSLKDFRDSPSYSEWLNALIDVVDAESWLATVDIMDFDMRARILDLILYLYVRSASVLDQHAALFGRTHTSAIYYTDNNNRSNQKTTTTVLLKPFFTAKDLARLERDSIFKKAAFVLWSRLVSDSEFFSLQTSALLLLRLHSRRITDVSSEVEDIIVSDLTSSDKVVSASAAKKFRDLWVFYRILLTEEAPDGAPMKPMNRVIMVLLGFIADDLIGTERIELRTIAYAWFLDCSRHNDLHRIIRMLLVMLVNPATARVSIQFVQVASRITHEQLPIMPSEANAVSLTTECGKQTFHHVCRDIDVQVNNSLLNPVSPWNNFSYIDCSSNVSWVVELIKQLLMPSTNFVENPMHLRANPASPNLKQAGKCHKRTMSDIPQFDEEDAESVGSLSLDSFDHDVLEILQSIVDTVVEEENIANGILPSDRGPKNIPMRMSNYLPKKPSAGNLTTTSNEDESSIVQQQSSDSTRNLSTYDGDEISIVNSAPSVLGNTPREINDIAGNNIRRIKCGHRRQDSLQESIFSTTTQELRLFDPAELPNITCPGDAKQPLLDETHSHMLFYAESPRIVDLGRAEKIFRTICALLKSGYSLGRHIVNCLIFTNITHLKSNVSASCQLVDLLARHYRHMQGGGFWSPEGENDELNGNSATIIPGADKNRNPTLFEMFSTILLYYFRSYYLNSPTNYVSPEDLIMAWKCKIAALDCFTELLRILNDVVKEANSRDFVSFIQQIYRFTRTQRAAIALMLTAVPSPPTQKGWRMPLTVDIAEFNNGPQNDPQFKDLIFAYHRSLLSLVSQMVVLEYNMHVGLRSLTNHSFGFAFERLMENRQLYNSPQNRSTIRDPRYMVVELKMFISVILNALKRCPERHELWLQFLIGTIPYSDRALPTFVVHVVEQICRNIYACLSSGDISIQSTTLESPRVSNGGDLVRHSYYYFADFRIPKATTATSPSSAYALFMNTPVKYPANYMVILMECLMSMLHFCLIDPSIMNMSHGKSSGHYYSYGVQPNLNHNLHNASSATANTHSSSNVSSMVGSAMSVFPGINNLFGKVFTSTDTSGNQSNVVSGAEQKASESWFVTQKELIKILPSALAILCDVWSFASKQVPAKPTIIGSAEVMRKLVLDILNPIAKKHPSVLINAFGIVWISRRKPEVIKPDPNQEPSFNYSIQQTCVVKLVLSLRILPLNSVIMSTSDALKEAATKQSAFFGEVALLELLHECTRQVSIDELYDSWSALNILFNESPLSVLPARASFLHFMILLDFARRCGTQRIVDDKHISRQIIDVCQKVTDAVNGIVGWQLESTTWLKRTLVVKQDATSIQKLSDISPTLDHRNVNNSVTASEAGSIRGSTISLAAPTNRLSSIDAMSQFNGSIAQLSLNSDMKKSSGNLRSSVKDTTSNKRDPADSINALLLLRNLADLIDSICRSEDKEKLLPTLHAVWANTLPYLKAKKFFLASSQLLASISSYNYMRPVWKKSAMDLLLDQSFFKMDIHALREWLVVIDNLMTNDKISFKELLARLNTGTTTTLSNLITSKEQEYELRAQSLKRLAFVILSSELDQYSAHLNEIQERLTESLRLAQAPIIHVQVFVCYRLLLIRMRPANFVSLWPSMVTELVQVLTQIEQLLSGSNTNNIDDLKCSRDDHWMQLYLAACKLLETLCTLPSGYVAQFQMCRWAFISALPLNTLPDVFVPFAVKINNLLNSKYSELSTVDRELRSASLFSVKTLTSFQELHPFFYSLATQHDSKTALNNSLNNGSINSQNEFSERNFIVQDEAQ